MDVISGNTTTYVYFVAVDATDYVTRETGLASFTVARSRNGAADAAYTTPTITEIDATAMPGVYALLVDEDTTLDSGFQSQEIALHITHAGMAPVTRVITLVRSPVTAGQTLTVTSGLASANTTQIEGADPSDTIRDAVVDDATRIDASALNTASVTTIPAILDDTDLIDDATSGLAKIATDVAAVLVDTAEIGTAGAGLTNINLPNQTMDIIGNITGNLSGSVGSVTGAINTAAGVITTLDALDTAQDSQHSTTQGKVDTAQADLDILTGTDGATLATSQPNYAPATQTSVDDLPTNAELATALGTADDAVLAAVATTDGKVDAIKAKTDSLAFTVSGQVNANLKYVNDIAVTGSGTSGDPWGPV